MPASPSRPRVVARPAPRPGVAALRGRHPEHRRRVHDVPPPQARTGRGGPDRDGPRDRLSDGRAMTGARSKVSEPTADAALVRRVRWRLLAWSGGTTLMVLV